MYPAWLTIPAARPELQSTVGWWKKAGCGIALWRDPGAEPIQADYLICDAYPGYARAVNQLIERVMQVDRECDWFIAAGDDVMPDPHKTAEQIACELVDHFKGTWGVMQPTGHRWGDHKGAYIDRAAGSAWIGREFCRRVYGGNGPLWSAFHHMFVDEHLQCVAQKLGVFWQRTDLAQIHQHWGLPRSGERMAPASRKPKFLEYVNSAAHWAEARAEFERLKAGGFAEANDLLP
ncbi:MAG TPA: hypothetical protein VFO46_02325 [Candidatus Sulfotelmatobacter sp.]|nr:hypothetical protein [Candidatus Sulfotelmatobacter sp.]